MTADKRADFVTVNPDNGALNLWINNCWPSGNGSGDDGDGDSGGDDGDGVDPYTPDPNDDMPLPTCPFTPTTIDEIQNLDYNNKLPPNCVPKYMLSVFLNITDFSRKKYDEIMSDHYDHYFEVYADYLVENSGQVLMDFMYDHGNEYYDCQIWQEYPCCTSCDYQGVSCSGCLEVCNIESGYDNGDEWHLRDQPCPPDYSQRNGIDNRYEQSIIWSFKNNSAEDEFYGAAETEVGAPRKRFEIADHQQTDWFERSGYVDDEGAGECILEYRKFGWDGMTERCQYTQFWSNAPVITGFESDDVSNPKDIVEKVLQNITDIFPAMGEVTYATIADEYDGDPHDLVDALVLQVLTLQAAVGFMENILKMGEKIEEEQKKEFIINLISSILVVVSLGGEALVEEGVVAVLGRMLVYTAEGGQAAIGLMEAIEDPQSTPLAIFGIMQSVNAIRDVSEVAKAAKLRRTMTRDDIAKFNEDVANYMTKVSDWNKKPDVEFCRYA